MQDSGRAQNGRNRRRSHGSAQSGCGCADSRRIVVQSIFKDSLCYQYHIPGLRHASRAVKPVSYSERCPPCTTSIAEARRHCYHTRKRSSQRTNNSYVSEFDLLQIGNYYLLRDRRTPNDARIRLCSVHAYPGLSHQQSPTATMRVVKNRSCCWPASMALYLH